MTKILVICLGNICRSPMAQTVIQHMVATSAKRAAIVVESAGTGAQTGERTDPRAEAALTRHGYRAGKLRARRFKTEDFERFDLILAMDNANLAHLRKTCPDEHAAKLHLFLDATDNHHGQEVPDPYYGNAQGFDKTLQWCELGAQAWLKRLAVQTL